jgi:hypothetical protein
MEKVTKIASVWYKILSSNTKEDFSLPDFIGCLRNAIHLAWSQETCHPCYAKDWSHLKPAMGQSDITAILIFNLFGGRIIKCFHKNYYWNELPNDFELGKDGDLENYYEFQDKLQFSLEGLDSEDTSEISADFVETIESLFSPLDTAKTRERYEIFEERVVAYILSAYGIHD